LTRVVPELHAFGCCHEVFGTQALLAEMAKNYLDLPELPSRDEICVNVMGINHFTWIDRATFQEYDLLEILKKHIQQPGTIRPYDQAEVEAQENWFFDSRQIKYALFQRFGVLAAAGDRHLSEFIPGFVHSPQELFRWGVIRTPVAWRIQRRDESAHIIREYLTGIRNFDLALSGEEVIRQIKALVGLGDFVTNINFENNGQAPDLPAHAVLETNACICHGSIHPLVEKALPAGIHTMVARHVANQEMIVEAGLTGDKDLAFQAVFNDPTTDLPIDKAWEMVSAIGFPESFKN